MKAGFYVELKNEQGIVLVRLEIDDMANGERLRIVSALTGDVAYLDALALETLTWIDEEIFSDPESQ